MLIRNGPAIKSVESVLSASLVFTLGRGRREGRVCQASTADNAATTSAEYVLTSARYNNLSGYNQVRVTRNLFDSADVVTALSGALARPAFPSPRPRE